MASPEIVAEVVRSGFVEGHHHGSVVALAADGSIADPDTAFLASRREWDDASFDAAFQSATGKKPPRERQRQ